MAGMWIKRSSWSSIKNMWIRTTVGWSPVRSGYIRVNTTSTGWKRFWFKADLPNEVTKPRFNSTNTGAGTIYDGPTATSPQYLNADLFGKDGTYSNYTAVTGRKISYGDTATADINSRTTLVNTDRFTSAGGVTSSNRLSVDQKYLFYEMTVENGTNLLNQINSISNGIKMIKSYPDLTDMGWTGAEQVGTQLSLSYTIENYYYNKIDPALSYVRWWRSSSTNAGGTLLKEETITATSTGATSTSRTGTSYYTPVSADAGYYIVAEITGRSSYTEHYGYTDNYMMGSYPTGGVIGQALTITGVSFTDSNGRSGKNARGNLVTATQTRLNWTVTGVNTGTTFRVRYRVLNNQTGLYYNPNDPTTSLAAGSAWLSYTDNYNGTGTISSVSINGTTATLYDYFTIDSTFNGSTYGGGISKWSFQYEISVVSSSGTRSYWVYPNSMSTSQANDYWDIDPTTNPSISANPTAISSGSATTISGTFNSFPSSLSSYPHSYKVDYGDGTDTGWVTLSSSTANQTYSLSKTYSTAGTYTATVSTTPFYTSNSATISVNSFVVPTITNVTYNGSGTVTVTVQNGGPYYQIYWTTITNPSIGASYDAASTTTSISETLTPTAGYSYYFWARSSTQNLGNTATSGTATAGTYSDWSSYYTIRQVSYNYNGGSGTTSLDFVKDSTYVTLPTPSSRTGYTFNGWYDSSSGGTYVGTSGNSYYVSSTLTLYAQWTADTYAINYYNNGGTGSPSAGTKTYNVTFTLSTTTPTQTGYTFAGWNTNSSGTGTNYAAGASYTTNAALDLYAKWTSNATAPGAPSGASIGTLTYAGSSLSTLLNPYTSGNSTKVQTWTYDSTVTFPVSYTAGSGATSHEFYMSSSSTAPTTQNATHTSNPTATQTNRGVITRYIWVRAKNDNGVSAWVSAGSKTSTATVVSGLTIKICRAGTTTCTNGAPSSQNALSYTYTSVNTGFSHDAYVSATISGNALNASY